jgi:hypothetical protein
MQPRQPRSTSCIGNTVLEISIQSRSSIAQDTSEVLRTLTVLTTVASMKVEHGVKCLYASVPLLGMTGLDMYKGDYW